MKKLEIANLVLLCSLLKNMRHLWPLFTFSILLFSCDKERAEDPLEAARQKLTQAKTIAFELEVTWNNTYVKDTVVDAPKKAHYVRNNREGFAYDFVYEMGTDASIYKDGKLEYVNGRNGRLIVYDKEEAKQDLAYEGNTVSMMSPMEMIKDTTWVRAGKEGDIVFYERVVYERESEEGHRYSFARLKIDSLESKVVSQEEFSLLNGAPQQHLVYQYTDFRFNQSDSLYYLYPEGLNTIANADLEKQRLNEGLKPGDVFPIFDLADTEGKLYSSESLYGKKLVFAFSFIGCGGCEYARKELAKSDFEFNEEYVGFYVNPRNSVEQIISYHADKPWPFRMAATDYDFSERYGVYTYPTFITVGANGKVEEIVEGYDENYFANKGGSS